MEPDLPQAASTARRRLNAMDVLPLCSQPMLSKHRWCRSDLVAAQPKLVGLRAQVAWWGLVVVVILVLLLLGGI